MDKPFVIVNVTCVIMAPENKNPMTLRSWERLKITPFTSESQNWNLQNVFEGRPFHVLIIKRFSQKKLDI